MKDQDAGDKRFFKIELNTHLHFNYGVIFTVFLEFHYFVTYKYSKKKSLSANEAIKTKVET